MKKKINDKFPKDYTHDPKVKFEAPEIMFRRNMMYQFVKKFRYIYQYKREIFTPDGEIRTYNECFTENDLRLIEYYNGETGEYKRWEKIINWNII